jgi:hypothetical protein
MSLFDYFFLSGIDPYPFRADRVGGTVDPFLMKTTENERFGFVSSVGRIRMPGSYIKGYVRIPRRIRILGRRDT